MERYDTVILGAGVSGLATALGLVRGGHGSVLVLECEDAVGGQCRTLERGGARFDTGSHRIHENPSPRAFALIRELCGDALLRRERGGKLRVRGAYIDYPITSFRMFTGLGWGESLRCALSLARARLAGPPDALNYESYLRWRAGDRGYRVFYEPYARKVWGCEPSRISMTAVKKRISMTKPMQIVFDMLRHAAGRGPKNFYYYVEGGIGELPRRMAAEVEKGGGRIRTGARCARIERLADGLRLFLGAGEVVECDRLVSTIQPRALLGLLGIEDRLTCEAQQLTWRGIRFACLHVESEPLIDGETFYFPELEFPFGRVSVPGRYTATMLPAGGTGSTVLCEVPCGPGDRWWDCADGELIEACYDGLRRAGFLKPENACPLPGDFAFRLGGTYPIYYSGWEDAFEEALGLLAKQTPAVFACGKQGLYLHCNLDHAMEVGLQLAEHLVQGGLATAWHVRAQAFHALRIRD